MSRFKNVSLSQYLIVLFASLVVFGIVAAVAGQQTISPREAENFFYIYDWPRGLNPIFWVITQIGSVWVVSSAVIIYAVSKKWSLALRLLGQAAVGYLLVYLAKQWVERPRPYILLPDVVSRENISPGLGFPSGHTALATILMLTILPYVPKRWRWVPWLTILLVGLSRIYLGVHAPLDIVGGFAIGLIVVYSARVLYQLYRQTLGPSKPQKA